MARLKDGSYAYFDSDKAASQIPYDSDMPVFHNEDILFDEINPNELSEKYLGLKSERTIEERLAEARRKKHYFSLLELRIQLWFMIKYMGYYDEPSLIRDWDSSKDDESAAKKY